MVFKIKFRTGDKIYSLFLIYSELALKLKYLLERVKNQGFSVLSKFSDNIFFSKLGCNFKSTFLFNRNIAQTIDNRFEGKK